MADPTFGVKIAPELKEKIDQLFKDSDFSTQKEWFQHMLSIYDLHQLRNQDGSKRYANDLDYIVQNLTRVQETIVQMMKKTADDAAHQEAESIRTFDELKEQLRQSDQLCKSLESKLIDTEELTNQHKNNLTDLQKQSGVLDDLCKTLKKSLLDREAEIDALKHERAQWVSSDYPATIQSLTTDNQALKQQCQMQQHQIDLLRMEYEKKLEVEQLKLEFAKKETEFLLLSQRKAPKEDPNVTPRKRGRPRGQQQLTIDDHEIHLPEDDEGFDFPDKYEDIEEMLGYEPPIAE
ncbi:hypothetical protein [Paenibacillus sp. FSL E2-0201]|uniref:hypothetical protein n=1 Tax=Paenibacillus sp. FSL E2-0201 TaxID=2954726 RepID=UPI0030DDD72C